MKPSRLALLGVVLLATLGAAILIAEPTSPDPAPTVPAPPFPNGDQPGRYILQSGRVADLTEPTRTEPIILRLDTATGQAWRYCQERADNLTVYGWEPVSEDFWNDWTLALTGKPTSNTLRRSTNSYPPTKSH